MSIFAGSYRKTSTILLKTDFSGLLRISYVRRQGFLEAGCNGTRSAPSALHFVQRFCNRRYRATQVSLWSGINQPHPFWAGSDNTLDLSVIEPQNFLSI